ncbi:hypothetical protein [Streptomyces aureus]|uniref:hypothetical protein n=1 Tax=Streptomyces aureus TaxID=193461 RepID=UPI0006921063|nr:hypothetical protein [Streptomyces aureus]
MPIPPRDGRAVRAAAASLGAAGLIALAGAPAAFGDENDGELLVGGLEPVDGVKPGGTFDLPVVVTNKTTVPVDKMWITYSVTRGLGYADVPSNCRVQQVRSYDEMPERRVAVCGFDQGVEPGAVYTPEKPLRAKVLDRGPTGPDGCPRDAGSASSDASLRHRR